MKASELRKRGSAYLLTIGILAVLGIVGFAVSQLTSSGRWSTIFSSNEKYTEECAESAANLTFKIVKDNMNDYNAFWKLFSNPTELLKSWFMYFRLPTAMAEAYVDPVNYEGAKANGIDVQLDLFNNLLFKPLYENGLSYVYDTVTDDTSSPLSPLKTMFTAHGGRVRVVTTGRIKSAFGILASGKSYVVGGVEVPLRQVTGFMATLFDKVKIKGEPITSGLNLDPTGENGSESTEKPNIDILNMLPDDPLIEAPDITDFTIIIEGVPVPVGVILQKPLDAVFAKISSKLGLTPQKIAKKIFGDSLSFNIDFSAITKRVEDAIHNCLPECLQAFAGNVDYGVTIEKQGVFEVVSEVEFYPDAKTEKCIKKKLVMHRDFRVADIQPIASDYSFFIANSTLLYEDDIENVDDWEGDDQIDWDSGSGAFIVHNMPSLSSFFDTFKAFLSFDLKEMARGIQLPGLVRVNGTKEMLIKLTMFKEWPTDGNVLDVFKRMEILALLTKHKSDGDYEKTACSGSHDKESSHNIIPGMESVMYNFWDKGKPFDWPYFGGGRPGGNGSYWLPIPPSDMSSNLLFGNFHIEFPFSMRVEGYLKKVYSHIKLLLVKIYIPPIPIIGFLGMDIPIPWFWATAEKEPYGFCMFPPYKSDEEAAKAWDPKDAANLPANTYSPTQYLKKASYFYPSSREFTKDMENRTIDYDGKRVFVCDGVTFVNDSLWLEDDFCVMGRGILVAAGNVHLKGNITKIEKDTNENSTLFSIVARNGALINHGTNEIHACLFGDKGLEVKIGSKMEIYGNLVLNRFNRDDIKGDVHVYYQSKHCRSSLLSMIRPIAKWDPTRYYTSFSSQTAYFKFEKPQ